MTLSIRVVALSFLLSILYACGGGSGSDGDANADVPLKSPNYYFPMDEDIQWTYSNSTQNVTFNTKIVLNGQSLLPLRYPTGGIEYFSSTTDEISFHGFYSPYVYISGAGSFQIDVKLDRAFVILPADAEVGSSISTSGSGTVNIQPTYGQNKITFSGKATYVGDESVIVPFGTFDTKRVHFSITVTTQIQGAAISLPIDVTLWLADGVGIVQRSEGGQTLKLISFTGGDRDRDGIKDIDDNCLTRSNTDQEDLDDDNIGDACDADANGDNIQDGELQIDSSFLAMSNLSLKDGIPTISVTQDNSPHLPWEIRIDQSDLGEYLGISQTSGTDWPIQFEINVLDGLPFGNYSATLIIQAGFHSIQLRIEYSKAGDIVVNAGENKSTNERDIVTLAGSYIVGNGNLTNVYWHQTSGPLVTLTQVGDPFTQQFISPEVTEPTLLTFQLEAYVDTGDSHINTVDIIVLPVFDPGVINLNVSGHGTVSANFDDLDNCTDACTSSFVVVYPSYAYLTAAPDANFDFVGWTGDCTGTGTCIVPAMAESGVHNITAVFQEKSYATLNISINGNGSVIEQSRYTECGNSVCTNKEYQNVSYVLQAASYPGYIFTGWSGDCSGLGVCNVPMTHDEIYNVTANFETTDLTFNICPGNGSDAFSGSGKDRIGYEVYDFIPLCNGWMLIAFIENLEYKVVLRDVVSHLTSKTYPLSATPAGMALDSTHKILYVAYTNADYISRINLATEEHVKLYSRSSSSVAVTDDGHVFGSNGYSLNVFDTVTGLFLSDHIIYGLNIQYNNATDRLITHQYAYAYDHSSQTFTQENVSAGEGFSYGCTSVYVSHDGLHTSRPCSGGNTGALSAVADYDAYNPSNILGIWSTGPHPQGAAYSLSNKYVLLSTYKDLFLYSMIDHQLVGSLLGYCGTTAAFHGLGISNDGKLLFGTSQCDFLYDDAIVWWARDTN